MSHPESDLGLSKRKRQMDQDLDKFSHLPEHLTDKILSLLPIRDAARTSILSSSWRFKWTSISKLLFDDRVFTDESSCKFVKIIDRVLLHHSGPVKKFELWLTKYGATSDIDSWFRYLSKASMNEFFLCTMKEQYTVPSSLFSCQDLTQLVLHNCSVTIPPTFSGFTNLKSLGLLSVPMSEQVLEKFISGSRFLTDLRLVNYDFKNLILDVPQLRCLTFYGSVEGISFKHTCHSSFVMDFHASGYVNLCEFFAPLRNINTLRLDGQALEFLSRKEVPAVLAEPLLLLKNLFISGVDFKNVKQILVILCLLRSSPNLNHVRFSVFATKKIFLQAATQLSSFAHMVVKEMEMHNSPFALAHLSSASLIGIGDSAYEMGFIGILLSSSPALQKMTIKAAKYSKLCPSGVGEHNLLKNMMRLQCPSTQAELIFV